MNEVFRQHVESLHSKFEALVGMQPVRFGALPGDMKCPGIYLFSEGAKHLCSGRSRNVRSRLGLHLGGPAGASFAFKLAREMTGHMKATYVSAGSRANLMTLPEFSEAFIAAKKPIRQMDVRFVAEPIRIAKPCSRITPLFHSARHTTTSTRTESQSIMSSARPVSEPCPSTKSCSAPRASN